MFLRLDYSQCHTFIVYVTYLISVPSNCTRRRMARACELVILRMLSLLIVTT